MSSRLELFYTWNLVNRFSPNVIFIFLYSLKVVIYTPILNMIIVKDFNLTST